MARDKKSKPKKKRWYSYVADAYRLSKRQYSWTPLAVWGPFFGVILAGLILFFVTKNWFWILIGVLFAMTVPLLILTQLVKKSSFEQLDGMPGAAGAVMSNIKRGWVVEQEPVRFDVKSKDMVYRLIGRPGVVIVGEGRGHRLQKLIDEERRAIKRVAPSAPIQTVKVGHGEDEVTIDKLEKHLKKLPKTITNEEVAAVAARLAAIQTNALPIPKGIDPFNARPNRRAMRG